MDLNLTRSAIVRVFSQFYLNDRKQFVSYNNTKLFLNLKLLKLDDIMQFQLCTFMYKIKYNKLPSVTPHYVHH